MVRLLVSRECLPLHVLHHDGFGDAVMDASVVFVEEILDEAEAALKGGSAIAKCALDGLPRQGGYGRYVARCREQIRAFRLIPFRHVRSFRQKDR
jgi:hypothetical protein